MLTKSQKSLIKEIVNTSNDYENDLNIFYEDTSFRGVEAEASDYYNDCVQRIFEQQMDEERLDEKALFGSLDKQLKKLEKEATKAKQSAEDINNKLQNTIDEAESMVGNKNLSRISIYSLKDGSGKIDMKKVQKVADALDAKAVMAALQIHIKETENALNVLNNSDFQRICKQIDDNTNILGGDRGKLVVKGFKNQFGQDVTKGLTSKSVKKDFMGGKKLGEDKLQEKDRVELSKSEFEKDFVKPVTKLSGSLQTIAAIEELLKKDETVQRVVKSQKITLKTVLTISMIAGTVLKVIGTVLPVPFVGAVGQLIASGTLLTKGGTGVVKNLKDIKNPNIPLPKKLLMIGGNTALMVFGSLGMKDAIQDFGAELQATGVLGAEEVAQANESADSASGEEEPSHASSNTTASEEMQKGKKYAAAVEKKAAETSNSNADDDVPLKGVEKNFVAGSNTSQLTNEEPTIENSIEAQANAKPGDIIERSDGTKWKLTKGDIDWAKSQIKEEPDIGEAPADDPDLENPLFDHPTEQFANDSSGAEQFINNSSEELDGGKYQDFNFSDLGKDGRKQFFDFVSKEEYIDKARSNVMVLEDGTKIQVDPYVDDNDNPLYHIGITPDGHGVIYDMKGRIHDLGEIGKKSIKLPKETHTPWIKYFDENGDGKLDSSVADALRNLKDYDTEENGFIKCDADWFENKLGVSMPEEETSGLDFGYGNRETI